MLNLFTCLAGPGSLGMQPGPEGRRRGPKPASPALSSPARPINQGQGLGVLGSSGNVGMSFRGLGRHSEHLELLSYLLGR